MSPDPGERAAGEQRLVVAHLRGEHGQHGTAIKDCPRCVKQRARMAGKGPGVTPPPGGQGAGVFTEADVERAAEALSDQFGRLGILSRTVVYRHHARIARTVLDAAASRAASAPPDEAAIRADERQRVLATLCGGL